MTDPVPSEAPLSKREVIAVYAMQSLIALRAKSGFRPSDMPKHALEVADAAFKMADAMIAVSAPATEPTSK
jgi:hypothetical protein